MPFVRTAIHDESTMFTFTYSLFSKYFPVLGLSEVVFD